MLSRRRTICPNIRNPFTVRGISVKAYDMYTGFNGLVNKGGQGGCVSSELEEVLRCSRRIAVLRDRKKVSEIDNDEDVSQQDIMREIAGGLT
jgi:ABC-type sugar transport system ATPase subunit